MFHCHVCGGSAAKPESVNEVFTIDGRQALVEGIPAQVCERCGEATFSRETTEGIRRLVHGGERPVKTVPLDVFAFSTDGSTPALVREKPAKYGK
jgi:HTH-type transcriptional regulator / antitoxin MqsA